MLIAAVLTIAPIARIIYILAMTGANTPSSDDEQFIPFFLGQIMSGHYNWLHFPRDTFQNTHVTMAPAVIYLALAYLDRLNIYHALYLGVALASVRLLLLGDVFNRLLARTSEVVRLLVWPVLAWLIFSVTQMSVFEHAFQSLKTALNELGLALGIWAMVRFKGRWAAIVLMGLGGIIASYSFACGLILWPLFVAGMAATGFRKLSHYLLIMVMGVVAAAPYADLLYFHRVAARQTAVASLFNPVLLVNYLGRPFTNGSALHYDRLPMSEVAGTVGVLLLATGIWLIWRDRRVGGSLEQAAPGLILAAFSILAGWQITVYRVQIAPWYIAFAMDFWIGLVGVACVVWSRYSRSASATSSPGPRYRIVPAAWCVAAIVIIIGFYVSSNRTRSDKSFFLRTRAPVSAECLRNYRTAPTYCEQTLVPWEPGFSGYLTHLARPLDEHRLSVFAPHQEWTLQGAFILDTVKVSEAPSSPEVYWSPDLSGSRSDFTDYNHLNLVLAPPNSVAWSITLPDGLEQADFHSAVSIAGAGTTRASETGVDLSLYVEESGAPARHAFSWLLRPGERSWHAFSVSLGEYAGRSITLRLIAAGQANGTLGLFRYPYIDVRLKGSGDQAMSPEDVRPANTDLSPACPTPGPLDYHLALTDSTNWKIEGLVPAPSQDQQVMTWRVTDANPSLEYTAPMEVDLAKYSRVFIRMAASAEIDHRAVRIYYKTDLRQEFNDGMVLVIPLLADGGMHTYTYDLRLTGIRRSRLSAVKIIPIRPPSLSATNHLEIADFGLIRRADESE